MPSEYVFSHKDFFIHIAKTDEWKTFDMNMAALPFHSLVHFSFNLTQQSEHFTLL